MKFHPLARPLVMTVGLPMETEILFVSAVIARARRVVIRVMLAIRIHVSNVLTATTSAWEPNVWHNAPKALISQASAALNVIATAWLVKVRPTSALLAVQMAPLISSSATIALIRALQAWVAMLVSALIASFLAPNALQDQRSVLAVLKRTVWRSSTGLIVLISVPSDSSSTKS